MPGVSDDRELAPLYTYFIPSSYVRISQPADQALQVGLTRASIERMMLLGTFRLMSNHCARKLPTLRGYRCSLRTAHSE